MYIITDKDKDVTIAKDKEKGKDKDKGREGGIAPKTASSSAAPIPTPTPAIARSKLKFLRPLRLQKTDPPIQRNAAFEDERVFIEVMGDHRSCTGSFLNPISEFLSIHSFVSLLSQISSLTFTSTLYSFPSPTSCFRSFPPSLVSFPFSPFSDVVCETMYRCHRRIPRRISPRNVASRPPEAHSTHQ